MHHQKAWELFLDLCLETKVSSRLNELLSFFLTMEEKEHLSSRMQIIAALLEGNLSQREISDTMKVSISQITRGSNALKMIDRDLLGFLEKHMRQGDKK